CTPGGSSPSLVNSGSTLMGMTRHNLPQIPIRHGEIQTSPSRKLPYMVPVKLLPWRIVPDRRRLVLPLPPCDLLVAQKHIHSPDLQIPLHLAAGLENREVPSHRRLWRRVQNRWTVRCSALPSVAETGQHPEALAHHVVGRRHVHHFG